MAEATNPKDIVSLTIFLPLYYVIFASVIVLILFCLKILSAKADSV